MFTITNLTFLTRSPAIAEKADRTALSGQAYHMLTMTISDVEILAFVFFTVCFNIPYSPDDFNV